MWHSATFKCAFYSALILIFFCISSCSIFSSDDESEFSGILRTDITGTILGGDETDWLPRSTTNNGFPTNIAAGPAYPNPAEALIAIPFQIPQADSVSIVLMDRSDRVVKVIVASNLSAGRYIVNVAKQNKGFYRVMMKTKSGFSGFGDIEFR